MQYYIATKPKLIGMDTCRTLQQTECNWDVHMQNSMRNYCMNTVQCRHQQLMAQFSETVSVTTSAYMHML